MLNTSPRSPVIYCREYVTQEPSTVIISGKKHKDRSWKLRLFLNAFVFITYNWGPHGPRYNWDYLWAPLRCLKRASFLANSAWGSLAGMPSSTLGSGILFPATFFVFLTKLFTSQKSPSLYFARVNHFVIDHFLSGEEIDRRPLWLKTFVTRWNMFPASLNGWVPINKTGRGLIPHLVAAVCWNCSAISSDA